MRPDGEPGKKIFDNPTGFAYTPILEVRQYSSIVYYQNATTGKGD